MFIVSVGLDYKAAPVDLREKLAISEETIPTALSRLGETLPEVAIISTCNRTELYAVAEKPHDGYRILRDFLCAHSGLSSQALQGFLFNASNSSAVKHLFGVASGLDSMILGEPQILGQVKMAFERAVDTGAAGKIISALFRDAITTGKRVRTETEIGQNAVSLSYVAVELARTTLGPLQDKSVVLLGAGKMSELAVKNLLDCGASRVTIMNRTLDRAEELAATIGGKAAGFDSLEECLAASDVVICSTAASQAVIVPETMIAVMSQREGRPILLVDIAVPRDVAPEVREIPGVYLYDIDDLQKVILENRKGREQEAEKALDIVQEDASKFMSWFKSLEVVPLIVQMREKAERIRRAEMSRHEARLNGLSEKERVAVESLTASIVNKILHEPTIRLKERAGSEDGYIYTSAIRDLFGLKDGNVA